MLLLLTHLNAGPKQYLLVILALIAIILFLTLDNQLLHLLVWFGHKRAQDKVWFVRQRGRRIITFAAWYSQAVGSKKLRVRLVQASYDAAREAEEQRDMSQDKVQKWESTIINWAFTHERRSARLNFLIPSSPRRRQ